MTVFRSRFLFIVLAMRVILFLSLLASLVMFLFMGTPSLWNNHPTEKAIILISLGFFLFTFLVISVGNSLVTQRFILIIQQKEIAIKDILLAKTISLNNQITGYSISTYSISKATPSIMGYFKTLVIYLKDGKTIEFPQFLYSNFKSISTALEQNNIKFLGQEPFRWKNLLLRKYQFK